MFEWSREDHLSSEREVWREAALSWGLEETGRQECSCPSSRLLWLGLVEGEEQQPGGLQGDYTKTITKTKLSSGMIDVGL